MRDLLKAILLGILLLIAAFGSTLFTQRHAIAEEAVPERRTEILVTINQYQWWLTRWSNNEVVCGINVEHEGAPTNLEMLYQCGESLYNQWLGTPACNFDDFQNCKGFYMFLAGYQPAEKNVFVDLPTAKVWLELEGCDSGLELNGCNQIPTLIMKGEEPLPNERITKIHLLVDGQPFECSGARCEFPLLVTSKEGSNFEFWAESSFGDESEHFTARIRVLDAGVQIDPNAGKWFVDIISSQWLGDAFSACAATWESFPPLGAMPDWVSTPDDHTGLASDTPFVYLAGELISQGIVDASSCAGNGLLANGAASQCGLESARSVVNDWQDQFDKTIFEVAVENNIPAQLLKNLFAQESQFWPGLESNTEFGLGQLTAVGADTPFLWNPSFFEQFCPLVLHAETCDQGYLKLSAENQALVRGALAAQTSSQCPECPMGIDLTHAQGTVNVFAQTLLGHCSQVAFIVSDITGELPGVVATYEDMWRFTLASYNAGPHCLAVAMNRSVIQGRMTWETVSSRLSEGCRGAVQYVERVTGERLIGDADFIPPLAPTPTPFAAPNNTNGSAYPAPTATPAGYP